MTEFELDSYPRLEVGQAIEICFERYGNIKQFIVDAIKPRTDGEYQPTNGAYIRIRELRKGEKFQETVRDGVKIYKVK